MVLNRKKENGGKRGREREREIERGLRERYRRGSEWVRERGRLLKRERQREREREKDEERRTETLIFLGWVARKYLIGEEMGKKGVIKVQNPYFISINRLIRKYILSFHP